MKKIALFFLAVPLLAVLATLVSLCNRGACNRSVVDPTVPSNTTETVSAWGWPLQYLVDEPGRPPVGKPGQEDRLLKNEFLADVIFFAIPCAMFAFVLVRLSQPRPKISDD